MLPRFRGRRLHRPLLAAMLVAGLIALSFLPVETRSGVDFRWTTKRIRLYEKAAHFLSRDLQTRRIAREVAAGERTDAGKAMAIFRWVGRNVRPTPEGFPIVDDHPLHILIRGYGADDQRVEAFALLAAYNGIPAQAVIVEEGPLEDATVAVARIGDGVYLFDLVRQVVFVDGRGALAHAGRIASATGAVRAIGPSGPVPLDPYRALAAKLSAEPPTFVRMELQKPWGRLKAELSRVLGSAD